MASRKSTIQWNQLLYIVIALVILGAANAAPQVRRQRGTRVEPVQLPDPYPEFQAIALLLGIKAEANIGAAITPQDNGRHLTAFEPNLARFQLFREANASNPINSGEMHKDGTIYIAYTPTRSPTWYETYGAEDKKSTPTEAGASGRLPFDELEKRNLDLGQWLPNSAAFRGGWGPAPHWFKIGIPRAPSLPLFQPNGWLNFLRSGSVAQINQLVRHATPTLPSPGDYCYRDTRNDFWSPMTHGDPPNWAIILPVKNGANEFGQRTFFPGLPFNSHTNGYVTWDDLMAIMQFDSDRALRILQFRGHPNTDDYDTGRVQWLSATVEGIVTNSFLAGEENSSSHRGRPQNYFLGSPEPPSSKGCEDENSLCNDWIVSVKPDPEYRFLLGRYMGEVEQGNFFKEFHGDLHGEIEQWQMPVGWRPWPGDRIYMTGRWVIDCGHEDWHAELHPYELVVSSHSETSGRQTAIGKAEVVSSVVITGAWPGGKLEFDVWPPARKEAVDILKWTGGPFIKTGLSQVSEEAQPQDNPNHLHVTVTSSSQLLRHDDFNILYYNETRRLVAKYRLWWERPPEFDERRAN